MHIIDIVAINCLFVYTYVYYTFVLSAQGNCTVTAINPANLTADGKGVEIAYGTQNVMIQCNCYNVNGKALSSVRWFDTNGIRIHYKTHNEYVSGAMYLMRSTNHSVVLVIPIFNNSYDGIYTCGIGRNFPPKEPNIDINLIFGE